MTDLLTEPRPAPASDGRDQRARLGRLVDPGSLAVLHESDEVAAVAARGRIGGDPVIVFCTDATRMGGSLGLAECARIADAINLAAGRGWPVLGMWHSRGGRLG